MRPARPELLVLVPCVAGLAALFVTVQWLRARRAARALGPHAWQRLMPVSEAFPWGRLSALVAGGVCIGLAAVGFERAGPPPTEPPPPLDVALVVDLSLSMSGSDVAPTRLARASAAAIRIAESVPAVRAALIVFADWPYTLVPLTDDPRLVRFFAAALDPGAMVERDRGTALRLALEGARDALGARPRAGGRRSIVLLSDGVGASEDDVLATASELALQGIVVHVGGVGTSAGTEIIGPGGPVRARDGSTVLARLDDRLLRAVAERGNGTYHDVTQPGGVDDLLEALGGGWSEPATGEDTPRDADVALMLLGLTLLLWEGAADAGRWSGTRRRARWP